jgi:magnesium chelatase subunit I
MAIPFPFVALVGQEELKQALLLNAIDPRIGGLVMLGHRGTAKTTAVRGLRSLLPGIRVHKGCAYHCDPDQMHTWCADCVERSLHTSETIPVPLVDLPLGATEDRVTGTLDLEAALVRGTKVFAPGLLASAHRGFLYIDEVNLLEDHLVDLLLDVAASGVNRVERDAISTEHPAQFVLIGSGNPEEGDLRPQLLDRFGLCVTVTTDTIPEHRREVLQRRLDFDDDPLGFQESWASETLALSERIRKAQSILSSVKVSQQVLLTIARILEPLAIDGHRGELACARSARARAALHGRSEVSLEDVRGTVPSALRHRLKRNPWAKDDGRSAIEDVLNSVLPNLEGELP